MVRQIYAYAEDGSPEVTGAACSLACSFKHISIHHRTSQQEMSGDSLMSANLSGEITLIIPIGIYSFNRPRCRVGQIKTRQDKSGRHHSRKRSATGFIVSSCNSSRLVVPFIDIIGHGVICRSIPGWFHVDLVSQLIQMQVFSVHQLASGEGRAGFLGQRQVKVQAVDVRKVTEDLIGIKEARTKVRFDGLVVVWVLESVSDRFLLTRLIFSAVPALLDSASTLN